MAPAPLLLLLIATVSSSLAHALWGKRWLQLPIFWLAACAGCLIVYAIGLRLPLPVHVVEPAGIPVVESVLLAWVLMFVASRLRV